MRTRAVGGSATRAGAAVLVLGAALAAAALAPPRRRPGPAASPAAARDAKGLFTAAALLAGSVFADSGVEHYRGGFRNPGMLTPLIVAGFTFAESVRTRRGKRSRGGRLVFAAAAVTGGAGLAFHVYNIGKRPGGFSWGNLFYAAPPGAPAALSLAGVLGMAGLAVTSGRKRLLRLPLGRWTAGLAALGLAGTVGEAGLLHYRGSFQNPFMWLPVTVPPVGAALLGRAAVEPGAPHRRPLTRGWLAATALLGVGGIALHIFGVSRAMGGWRNWRQNLVAGPPIPAPPAFTALALAGLAALDLRDREAA